MVTYHEADLATVCSILAMSIFTIIGKTGYYKFKTYQVYILFVQKVALHIKTLDTERETDSKQKIQEKNKSERRIQTHAHC